MTRAYALAFDTSLSFEKMLARLNERTPWRWTDWQNDRWGDYVKTVGSIRPGDGVVKILYDSDLRRHAVNVHFDSEAPDAQALFEQVSSIVLNSVLPALDAAGIVELDEDYSS